MRIAVDLESPSKPERVRITRDRVGLQKSVLTVLVGAACGIGIAYVFVHFVDGRTDRCNRYRSDYQAWKAQLETNNPSIRFENSTGGASGGWLGIDTILESNRYKTSTGKVINVHFVYSDRSDGLASRLKIESDGHALNCPVDDVTRLRKFDLKSEFPEAFH